VQRYADTRKLQCDGGIEATTKTSRRVDRGPMGLISQAAEAQRG